MSCIKHCKSEAFSLIELMVVIAIVAVLAVVAVPAYKNYIDRASTVESLNYIQSLKQQNVQYYTEHGYFGTDVDLGIDVSTGPLASTLLYVAFTPLLIGSYGCDGFQTVANFDLGPDEFNVPKQCLVYSTTYDVDGIIKETSCVVQYGASTIAECAKYFPQCADMGDGTNSAPLTAMRAEICQ